MRTKKYDHGVIEKTEIITDPNKIAEFRYFVLIIDIATKKVISRFGYFNSVTEAVEFAKLHGIHLD